MKKLLVTLLSIVLVFSMSAVVFADGGNDAPKDNQTAIILVNADSPTKVIAPAAPVFKDVSESDWFYDAAYWAYEKQIVNGLKEDVFGPNGKCTRGQVVTFFYRAEGEPDVTAEAEDGLLVKQIPFSDVSESDYFFKAVSWASANGIVNGVSADRFNPNGSITREQLAAILYRYAEYKGFDMTLGDDTNILSFDDIPSTASWAIPAIQWGVGAGVLNGMGSKFGSKETATRAQVVAIIYRALTADLMPLNITPADLEGSYQDSYTQRASMDISKPDAEGNVKIRIVHANSAFDEQVWEMTGTMYRNVITYSDCTVYEYLYSEDTLFKIKIEENVSGTFTVDRSGAIAWDGAGDAEHQKCVFEKIPA